MGISGDTQAVRLGDVLSLQQEATKVDPAAEYPNLGIYSFGRGLFAKPSINGATTSAPKLFRVRACQFIYSRLFAFEGAFGVVPEHMDGWYVSNEYPTFEVDPAKALIEFLRLAICRRSTWEELAARTVGMGHRRQRLRPEDFLDLEIDLPSLETQRRVVAVVSSAQEVARAARVEAEAAISLATALLEESTEGTDARPIRLGDVAQLDLDLVRVREDQRYPVAGVAIAGKGLFWREAIDGADTKYQRLHRLRAGQLVYRKLTAWEGPITVVPSEFEGGVVSPEFPTLTLDESQLVPGFMGFVCRQRSFHYEMKSRSTGTAERRNRLKPSDLLEIEIDVPPLLEQQRIANTAALATSLARQADTADVLAEALRDELLGDA